MPVRERRIKRHMQKGDILKKTHGRMIYHPKDTCLNSLLERDEHRTPYRKVTGKVTCKVMGKVMGKVTGKVTERRHLEMQFCNDAIDERAIRLPWNRRKRNASLTTRALNKEETG